LLFFPVLYLCFWSGYHYYSSLSSTPASGEVTTNILPCPLPLHLVRLPILFFPVLYIPLLLVRLPLIFFLVLYLCFWLGYHYYSPLSSIPASDEVTTAIVPCPLPLYLVTNTILSCPLPLLWSGNHYSSSLSSTLAYGEVTTAILPCPLPLHLVRLPLLLFPVLYPCIW
jgi:hypothetical protein